MNRLRPFFFPGLLVALTLAAYAHLAFTDRILARGDTYAYFYPYWEARSEAFRAGRLPLWSPHLFMGVPLLANSQIGTFYPPNWIVTAYDAPHAVKISLLFHVAWAGLGASLLARRALKLSPFAAWVAGAAFAFGGYVGAHVEQINQLQGLSWMPFAFVCLHSAAAPGRSGWRAALLLAGVLALQFFTGHTQTLFITGVGLGMYALFNAPRTALIRLAAAGALALILVTPQLVPTLELARLSNRGGGLNPNEATAFSFNPFVTGRGLLPSYDRAIFGEYIAYVGVIGIALALLGAWSRHGGRGRWTWIALAGIGLCFAFGLYNPVYYYGIAALPGFNLFRVPARWLALFALGAAMLIGLGVEIARRDERRYAVPGALFGLVFIVLAVTTRFVLNNPDGTPVYAPEMITWVGWLAAFGIGLIALLMSQRFSKALRRMLPVLLIVELVAANFAQAHTQTTPPEAWSAARFTLNQMRVYADRTTPPDRLLSISQTFFDPGDRAALETRYAALGMTAEQTRHALVAVKLKEVAAPNLPLAWEMPSLDGFDGGLLPTGWYTQFTALLLPEGTARAVDGRLREALAQEACFGACVPAPRWLRLTGTRYLILDKVFDLWHEDIAYDTGLWARLEPGETRTYAADPPFVATAVDVVYIGAGDRALPFRVDAASAVSQTRTPIEIGTLAGQTVMRARFTLSQDGTPADITMTAAGPFTVMAVTRVDTRTGDFQQAQPEGWRRALSSDIKLYAQTGVIERAFVVGSWRAFPDTYEGTEAALAWMRSPAFDPALNAALHSDQPPPSSAAVMALEDAPFTGTVVVEAYGAEAMQVRITGAANAGMLVVTDAYYPGWTAAVSGESVPIYRMNGMFRGVLVPPGDSVVTFTFRPAWLVPALVMGGMAWAVLLAAVLAISAAGKTPETPPTTAAMTPR
ncbi:MAG: YfhO family protein [bacterium]|nr:YfhO family protein [bacterium]